MMLANLRGRVQPLPGLKGKVALVIGGTRGVGRAVTEKLVASGCLVIANYAHSVEAAEALLADMADQPGELTLARGDASEATTVRSLLDMVGQAHGRLDVLVHAVSSVHPMSALDLRLPELGLDTASALVPLAAAGAAAGLMPGTGGRIIAVSSSVAHHVAPQLVSLGLAKAALENLVRFTAVELAGSGVTVNAVSTSKIDKGSATVRREVAELLAARAPAGRLTRPEDVADAVAMLCLPEAQWITGQVIAVDGGLGLLS